MIYHGLPCPAVYSTLKHMRSRPQRCIFLSVAIIRSFALPLARGSKMLSFISDKPLYTFCTTVSVHQCPHIEVGIQRMSGISP